MSENTFEFLSIPCTCHGSNASCFKCGGWGYLDQLSIQNNTGLTTSPQPSKKLPRNIITQKQYHIATPSKINYSELNTIHCIICRVPVKYIEKHIARVHSKQKTIANKSIKMNLQKNSGAKSRRKCTEQSVITSRGARELDTAYREILKALNIQSNSAADEIKNPSPDDLISCKTCKKILPRWRLEEHSWAAHGEKQKKSPSPKNHATHNNDRNSSVTYERSASRRDATRDYYSAYRESGKFGSHPAHDNFDDDSDPN